MTIEYGDKKPAHELTGPVAWKRQIHNLLAKIDTDTGATEHKTRTRVRALLILAEKVREWTRHGRSITDDASEDEAQIDSCN